MWRFCSTRRTANSSKNSILKRQPAWKGRLSRAFLTCRRAGCRVTFQDRVHVQEYRRRLDGGSTVPGDGCRVSLGLGQKSRSSYQPLANAPGLGKTCIEESAWVPGPQRERLLRKAMGHARYFKSWLRHRREVVQILRSRKESMADGNDRFLMLCPKESRRQAQKLHEEVVRISAEVKAAARTEEKGLLEQLHRGRQCLADPQ